MNAVVYKPSGEAIGKFEIAGIEDVSPKLQEFLASGVRTPLHSCVEAAGKTWTIVGLNPLQLREGSVARRLAKTQQSRSRKIEKDEIKKAKDRMVVGSCICLAGIVFTVLSYNFAVGLGSTRFLVATGAIFWGGIYGVVNFAKYSRAKLSGK